MMSTDDLIRVRQRGVPFSEPPFDTGLMLVSCSQRSPGISATGFLRHALGMERFLWADGAEETTFAGFGVAANLMAWGADRFQIIQRKAKDLFRDAIVFGSEQPFAAPRLFGGFAFRDDFAPDNTWSVFNPVHFVLPHYQFAEIGRESWLTINALLPPEENPEASLPQLQEALSARYDLLLHAERATPTTYPKQRAVQVNYPMPYSTWESKINHATQHMRTSELNKVVLSRVCEIRLAQRVDVDGALAYLGQQYAGCFRFLFEPRPFHAFFGATPELLARVRRYSLATMALASSVRRGTTPCEDEALAGQLLSDAKERYEHELVVDSLRRRVAAFADSVELPAEPQVLKLSNIQHLYTPLRARLRKPEGVIPIVAALHPTPALGGSPRHLAMEFIREAEPVPRGWYAGPIGCIDHELDGAFSVAIRSAVSQERRIWLYAGAGIVADSVPRKEWRETALKFRPILNALGVESDA